MRPVKYRPYCVYHSTFQYRKRYEVTCDYTDLRGDTKKPEFQYRKRYEVTCDDEHDLAYGIGVRFQYRKRYEVTCDLAL